MYSKRDLPDDLSEVASSKRFRNNLADLFLNNDVSAKRVLSVYQDAELASAENVKDLSSLKVDKNIHRNLLKKLLKKNRKQWPGIYYGKIRVFDIQKQQEVRKDIPFFLIHELLAKLAATSNLSKLCDPLALTELQAAHLQSCKIELKLNPDSILIPIGLWGDGAPCNWDRSESLDVFTMSLPGVNPNDKAAKIRLPLCAVNRKFIVTHHTFDDILEIVAWSLQMCALGKYPEQRHDDSPWIKSDRSRAALSGKMLGFRAVLTEVRGDWKFFKEAFRFQAWNETAGCCYKCRATLVTIRDVGPNAPWRTQAAHIMTCSLLLQV